MQQGGPPTMLGDIAKLVAAVAGLMWAGLAVGLVYLLRDQIMEMVKGLSGIEMFGVKLAISSKDSMTAAVELARKGANPSLIVPTIDRDRALARAKRERALLAGAELLWVDDHPAGCRNEARMIQNFGAAITFAWNTDEALGALGTATQEKQPFHAILSDIGRKWPVDDPAAGVAMLAQLQKAGVDLPVILYVNDYDPKRGIPPGAFGICNRPDELLSLVLDALARTRGPA